MNFDRWENDDDYGMRRTWWSSKGRISIRTTPVWDGSSEGLIWGVWVLINRGALQVPVQPVFILMVEGVSEFVVNDLMSAFRGMPERRAHTSARAKARKVAMQYGGWVVPKHVQEGHKHYETVQLHHIGNRWLADHECCIIDHRTVAKRLRKERA